MVRQKLIKNTPPLFLAHTQLSSLTPNSYLIRSSVLSGQVLTRVDSAGTKKKTVFDVDGRLVAVQFSDSGFNWVSWTHTDLLGLSEAGDTKPVYDPLGNYIPWQHVPSPPSNIYPRSSASFGRLGSSFGYAQDKGCLLNGLPISCSDLAHQIDIGNVAVDFLIMDSKGLRHREFDVVPLGLGMFNVWVPDNDGMKSGDAPPGTDPDGVVTVNHDEDDGLGHYESFLLSVAPQNTGQGLNPVEGEKRWNDCMNKYCQ